jgi:hypothetical protein
MTANKREFDPAFRDGAKDNMGRLMKQLAIATILVLIVTLVACGNSNNSGNINGNWTAALTNTAFNFSTSLSVNGGGSLSVTNFSFSTSSPCFVSGDSETGSFTLSQNFNGNVTGKFQFTVQSGSPSGNTLSLTGTANGNTISGMWTLTGGAGCNGSGNFTMTKM